MDRSEIERPVRELLNEQQRAAREAKAADVDAKIDAKLAEIGHTEAFEALQEQVAIVQARLEKLLTNPVIH